MFLITGLGNPGKKYVNTRHNTGFIAINCLSELYGLMWHTKSKFNARIAEGNINFCKVILCQPNTFINLSGLSISKLILFYKIKPENVIIIHDDIDVSFGKVKYKIGGSAGGHNGIKSINNYIKDYQRIRIGIGRPKNSKYDVSNFVLGTFTENERVILNVIINKILNIFSLLCDGVIEKYR